MALATTWETGSLAGERRALRRLRILLVDDSRAMRGIIKRTMQQAGHIDHDYSEASTAEEALVAIRRDRPDLVVCDWSLPGMNGLQLFDLVRAEGPAPRFGFVSSRVHEVGPGALARGALFALAKPVVPDDFKGVLAPMLSRGGTGLPNAEAVAHLLESLLALKVQVRPSFRAVLSGARPVLVGLYTGERGQGLLAMDLSLAAVLGAAMASAAPSPPRGWGKDRPPPSEPLEEARELLSVCAALFEAPGAPLSLKALHSQLRGLPSWAVALAVRPASQVCFEIAVPAYGAGHVALYVG